MTFRRIFASCVVALIGMLVPAWPAMAQPALPDPLDTEIVRATTLTPDHARKVKDYATQVGAVLNAADPGDGLFKRAREAALKPLEDVQASVAFRNDYAAALLPELERLGAPGKPTSDLCLINSLRIAGGLATPGAVDYLERFRADQRPAARYASMSGLARVFDAIRLGNPAIAPARATDIIQTLTERLKVEDDHSVLDANVRAFISAMETGQRQGFGALFPLAYGALAQGAGERLAKFTGGANASSFLTAMLRAGVSLRNGFLQQGGVNVPPAEALKAVELDAQLLAYLRKHLVADFPPGGPARDLPSQMATVAETSIILASPRLGGPEIKGKSMGDLVKKGDRQSDGEFVAEVDKLIGAGGTLTKAPFNLDPTKLK